MKVKILSILCLFATACANVGQKKSEQVVQPQSFSVPQIPVFLTTTEQRADFVVKHYWQNYNFSDTTLISRADYTEQAYVDFLNVLINVDPSLARHGIDTLMCKAQIDNSMYAHFVSLSEKYLYDPNSPFRNEELYLMVLQTILANDKLPEIEKLRPQYQYDLALKNRIGEKAIDFEYTNTEGKKSRLYDQKAKHLLLFFFRPDCPTCKEVKAYVAEKNIDKLVKIVWINPDVDTHIDNEYDLRASPTLYLLDSDKKVLMKDASIEMIENYMKTL